VTYYDLDGRPIDMYEWGRLFEDFERRCIASTELPGGCRVSTVWLGIDHSFGTGPPLIFESMVFGPDNNVDLDCIRYSTREQAEAGHSELVTRWTGWTPGDPPPEGAEASFLTRFIDAMAASLGERPVTPEESARNDQMVVMYPKELEHVADTENTTMEESE